jgi:hypothetical protein
MGNNITCSINCNYRITVTLYAEKDMFFLFSVNILHRSDNDDDDDDNNNDNNNNNNSNNNNKGKVYPITGHEGPEGE